MTLTPYHAKYFAFELTKRVASDSIEKLASALVDAKVDLNPHQVEAALFAFRSPLSKGAILADEVGLGKTIEAGLVLSQKWAERKRKILIIAPANLRKQWNQELQDKFYLESIILETKSFNQQINNGNLNPFDQKDQVAICSYQFAKTKAPYLRHIKWDLVVIDEAHRLRNVYKNNNVIAKTLKDTLEPFPKILLTATPLQNSLLELYGLVSIIDDHLFGDLKSFKAQYSRADKYVDSGIYEELKERLKPVTKRTLRRQVLEYIQFTSRKAFVFEFFPSDSEHQLYTLVSDYLQRERLYALPASQRQLMTLVLRRLLASSSFAISGTFKRLEEKLLDVLKRHKENPLELEDFLNEDYEDYDELKDEWEDEAETPAEKWYLEDELLEIKVEADLLGSFAQLAESIQVNSKGEKLIAALETGFEEGTKLGAAKKAIIFTESKRTQAYLAELLSKRGYAGKIVLFNGTNSDKGSRAIYQKWLAQNKDSDKASGSPSADMRAALVENFRNDAEIMIATEAAAEGINLQFCSVVVNYDMPWNPQRIEQRIGRCHRYGQKHDVLVINFLNKRNAADEHVYRLLNEKFNLFSGVFGASDEVLGSLESGVDIERKIAQIYQTCRTTEEITKSFTELRQELEENITQAMDSTKEKLLENFDEEVHEKLRINLAQSREYISKYETYLWKIAKYSLKEKASFNEENLSFKIRAPSLNAPIGNYKLGNKVLPNHYHFRINHPLAQEILNTWSNKSLAVQEVTFDYTNSPTIISALEPLLNKTGWISAYQLEIESFDKEDYWIAVGLTESGEWIDSELVKRFFSLNAQLGSAQELDSENKELIEQKLDEEMDAAKEISLSKNGKFFDQEYDKLEHWADDMKISLERELQDLDGEIKLKKMEARKSTDLKTKVQAQRIVKDLEKLRYEKRKRLFEAQDDIEQKKESLLAAVEKQLEQRHQAKELFTFKWFLK
jgi:superfamily II DNA or RNA helicase